MVRHYTDIILLLDIFNGCYIPVRICTPNIITSPPYLNIKIIGHYVYNYVASFC